MRRIYKILILTIAIVIVLIGLSVPNLNQNHGEQNSTSLPILLGIDSMNNLHFVGTPGYTEWGKNVSDNYHQSNDMKTTNSWNSVDPDIFRNGLIIKSSVYPSIVTLMIYKPQMCKEQVFDTNETEYIELCGNSNQSTSCENYRLGNELSVTISDTTLSKIADTCYAFSMFGVETDENNINLQTYMGTWFFSKNKN